MVTGLDISAALIERAQRLDAEANVSVEYVLACAEVTGRPDASAEVVLNLVVVDDHG